MKAPLLLRQQEQGRLTRRANIDLGPGPPRAPIARLTLFTASYVKRSLYITGQGPINHPVQSLLGDSPPMMQKSKQPFEKDESSSDSPRRSRGVPTASVNTVLVTAALPPLKTRRQPFAAIRLRLPRQKQDTPPLKRYAQSVGKSYTPLPFSEGMRRKTRQYKPGSLECKIGQRKRKLKLSRC